MSKDVALLIIDVQIGMFSKQDPVYAGNALLERIQGLITKARTCEVPVIYIQHNAGSGKPLEPNTPGWAIHDAIAPTQGDTVIQKTTPDSFHETNLQNVLDTNGIKKLVIAGIQTELCVDTTCRRAFSLGYNVVVAKDAHSTWDRGSFNAAEIIEYHNDVLKWFASPEDSECIDFCTL